MRSLTLFSVCVLCLSAVPARGDGTVYGRARFERIKGHPGNYVELYEWNLFLSPDDGTRIGERYRLGAPGGGGYYSITYPADWYTIYVTQPIFFARPKLVRDVQIIEGQSVEINPELAIDYSCYWMHEGDWSWSTTWYQTFQATGTSISRIQFLLAGYTANSVLVSVLQDNGGAITTWPQVGPARSTGAGTGDGWVGLRSGEIPTTPHQRYAIKLAGVGGEQGLGIRCRTEDGNGYALGQAYDATGAARNLDLLITVFSDNDGTVIPYMDRTSGSVEDTAGSTGTWGQTYRATSPALAAVDCFTAGGSTFDIDVEFRIRQNGPGGTQVGPTKTAQALYQAGNTGIVGVSYAPGEVPLTPNSTYYIEMSPAAGSPAFVAYKFHSQGDNGYPYGDAYWNGNLQSNVDLEMTIMEYKQWYSPTIVNPDFEDYGGYLDGWEITKLDGKGPDDPPHSDGAYGVEAPDDGHFAGKITSGQLMNFIMGQVIEVGAPGAGANVYWSLSANVHLHSRDGGPLPGNVHQLWEIGWNNDGSIPAGINRCDNYETIANVDGHDTLNDDKYFHHLGDNGVIAAGTGCKGMVLRVRMYNDAPATWSMSNIDNVGFTATHSPPTATIELAPTEFQRTVWIRNDLSNDVFTVRNAGPGTLNYQITDDAYDPDWLEVQPATGASAGETDPINIIYHVAGLNAGEYHATITVESTQAWNSPQTVSVTLVVQTVDPDFDGDADVDQEDFAHLQVCLTGMGGAVTDPDCANADFNGDEDVDEDDLATFTGCMTQAGQPADPQCEDP